MNICSTLLSIPVHEKVLLYTSLQRRKFCTVRKAVFFECRWQKSLIIFGISLGERCGYIFVFQSI